MPPDRDLHSPARPPAGRRWRVADDFRRRPASAVPFALALSIGLAAAIHLGFVAPEEPAPPPMPAAAAGTLATNEPTGRSARPPGDARDSPAESTPPSGTQWVSHDWIETPPRGRPGGPGERRSAIVGRAVGLRPEPVGSSLVHGNGDPVLCRTCLLHQIVRGGL